MRLRFSWSALSAAAVAGLMLSGCGRPTAPPGTAVQTPPSTAPVAASPAAEKPAETPESDVTLTADTKKVVLHVPGMA